MREVDACIKVAGQAFVVGKFPVIAIVMVCFRVLNQCDQSAPVILADHGIILPVAEALLAIDNGRAFIDGNLVGDAAAPAISAITFASDLMTAQETVQLIPERLSV